MLLTISAFMIAASLGVFEAAATNCCVVLLPRPTTLPVAMLKIKFEAGSPLVTVLKLPLTAPGAKLNKLTLEPMPRLTPGCRYG